MRGGLSTEIHWDRESSAYSASKFILYTLKPHTLSNINVYCSYRKVVTVFTDAITGFVDAFYQFDL